MTSGAKFRSNFGAASEGGTGHFVVVVVSAVGGSPLNHYSGWTPGWETELLPELFTKIG